MAIFTDFLLPLVFNYQDGDEGEDEDEDEVEEKEGIVALIISLFLVLFSYSLFSIYYYINYCYEKEKDIW